MMIGNRYFVVAMSIFFVSTTDAWMTTKPVVVASTTLQSRHQLSMVASSGAAANKKDAMVVNGGYGTLTATPPPPVTQRSLQESVARTATTTALGPAQSLLVRAGMMMFIASMCVALPATLLPQFAMYKLGLINRKRRERWALATGEFCARWLLRLMPFCKVSCESLPRDCKHTPAVWVCNHTSMLDVFLLMAKDRKLRGKNKRPIKIVYWKQLEENPITRLLFQQAGFIPVQMAANEPGEDNKYDPKSFRHLLKQCKTALADGFDIGILPEGQLNPNPENGLLPIFSGAWNLAQLGGRHVQIWMMAHYGVHNLWHPTRGMECTSRQVKVRAYPRGRRYDSKEEFVESFRQIVGHFGTHGIDLPNVDAWLDGTAYHQQQAATSSFSDSSATFNTESNPPPGDQDEQDNRAQ